MDTKAEPRIPAGTSNYRRSTSPPEQNPDGGEKTTQDNSTTTGDAQLRFPPCASPANGGNQPNADSQLQLQRYHPPPTARQADGENQHLTSKQRGW
jgi:hypothetical protein